MIFLSDLVKGSWVNINTLKHRFISDIVLNEKHTKKIQTQVTQSLKPIISQVVKKLPPILKSKAGSLDAGRVSKVLLAPAIDKETNRFRLSIKSSKSLSKPNVKLTKPRLGNPKKAVKDALSKGTKDLKDAAVDLAKQKALEAKKLAEQKKKEAEAKAKAELERKKKELEAKAKAEAKHKRKETEKKAKKEALKKARQNVKLPF